MSITPSERKKLRHFARTNPNMVRVGWWLEHHEIGITLPQLIEEPGMFTGVKTLKQARKRVYSEAGKRYLMIRALHGESTRTNPPWLSTKHDPRAKHGPKPSNSYFRRAAQLQMANHLATKFDALTSATLNGSTLTAVVQQKSFKP